MVDSRQIKAHSVSMIEVRKTETFAAWLGALRDREARLRIQVRIDRLVTGNPGQHRVLTSGIRELKIDHGPGYRVYYAQHGDTLVILLCGGDKRSQQKDIRTALVLAQQLDI